MRTGRCQPVSLSGLALKEDFRQLLPFAARRHMTPDWTIVQPPNRGFSVSAMQRPFAQVDVFTTHAVRRQPRRRGARRQPGSTTERCSGSRTGRISRRRRSCCRRAIRRPTTACGSSRPSRELPFAGHPTLGTCHAWLTLGGGEPERRRRDRAGVRRGPDPGAARRRRARVRGTAAAALGAVDEEFAERIAELAGIERPRILAAEWVDNGPEWIAILLASADAVLALRPGPIDFDLGVVGPVSGRLAGGLRGARVLPEGRSRRVEDPVTGSLNASLAQWLLGSGRATRAVRREPGHGARARRSRAHLGRCRGDVWVGGGTVTCISGTVEL